jgi:transcriptional antiterminator NusG
MFEEENESVEEQTLEPAEESAELEDSGAMEEDQVAAAVELEEPEAELVESTEIEEVVEAVVAAELDSDDESLDVEQDEAITEEAAADEVEDAEAREDEVDEVLDEGVAEEESEEGPEPDAAIEEEDILETSDADLEAEEAQEEVQEIVTIPELAAVEDEPIEVGESEEIEPVMVAEDNREWFVVHCYSGYENKVRHNLENRIETMNMKNQIFDVVVPTEEEMEVKNGKRRTVERRVFPGYILVQMLMNEDSWYVVRNTPGVTGFVGMGNEPTPLRPEEVSQIIKRMEAEAPRIKVTYKTGAKVRIIDGPFNDFIGTVDNIDIDKAKVRVMVSFFGRETPVELDFLQVEKA